MGRARRIYFSKEHRNPNSQGIENPFITFNNGIGDVNKEGAVVFDNAGRRVMEQSGKVSAPLVETARRVQQGVVEDYLGR